jgi:DNA polymerase-4
VFLVRDINEFIKDIEIEKFPGIGKRIEKKLKQKGIYTLGDVVKNREYLFSWGKPGILLYNRVTGIDEEVEERHLRKSIGISRRFDPVYCRDEILRRISILCRYLSFLVMKKKVNPTFYYLKIRYKNGKKSKAHTRVERLFNELLLKEIMTLLFYRADSEDDAVISIGLSVGVFRKTTNLFDYKKDFKLQKLNEAIYKIRSKYGVSALLGADEISYHER